MMNPHPSKSLLVKRLREDLIGPAEEGEVLTSYPTDVYLTGILFPPRSDISEEESDQLKSEGTGDQGGSDPGNDEVSLAAAKRPASAGLSFVVEAGSTPEIVIRLKAAIYRRDGLTEDAPQKTRWKREQLQSELPTLFLDRDHRDLSEEETGIPGINIHVRTSSWDGRLLVTVAMINGRELPDEYERETYEELCFFQTGIEVTVAEGTRFCARPLGGSAMDEDTWMAKLIYRDVEEYAVGHTCSAEWETKNGGVEKVVTTWLPTNTVKTMSSAGVDEFAGLNAPESGPVLSTGWLSSHGGEDLRRGLERLPAAYRSWLESQRRRVPVELHDDERLKAQAEKHIEGAVAVAARMERAIELLATDGDVEAAFRLANRAIMLQWSWSRPTDPPLVWRPFQLGFILLCLESVADEENLDRDVADLLWFPTGGGKTEAYLALVAFTLFLRRIRHGEEGAGVASFMRYTLRLLTIQQFQRAAALVCACDAIRQGDGVPENIAVKLTDIPFSIGLWVGGDATPNNFRDADNALRDPRAHNRPDQLKFCPRHRDKRLLWAADTTMQKVFARCEDANCMWHDHPLPVWTVDSDVYREQPSLVIGTIDKFAQVVRKPETRRLFGRDQERRSPDLIIQDELHLISGPLGTLTGLYECAIDRICSRRGRRPKIIASTATIREAGTQIRALFDRDTCLFPPPVLDADNSGFAVEDTADPGRCYLGITTAGRSAKFALQAAAASLMQAAHSPAMPAAERDDFWTLVAYFNSLRELGGALVLMQDDVGDSLRNFGERRGEPAREIREPMELTSRVSSTELKDYLDQLGKKHGEPGCCDVVLASNMISVGVDVPRLGMMIVNGQPKGIAEYIQATSRVGRRRGGPGGVVMTIYNNAKARDRSHFETFQTWHSALYREVEATSVTPFATRSRMKALHAVLVILARHLVDGLETRAGGAGDFKTELEDFIDRIVDRCEGIDPDEARNVERELGNFLERWVNDSSSYKSYWNDKAWNSSLLISAEKAAEIKARTGAYRYRAKPTPNSMRNVEPGTLFKLKEEL
jgi:hypothetical protein